MTEEDFLAWRENPVTQWFMAALAEVSAQNEAAVRDGAWLAAREGGAHEIDGHALNVLAVKAQVYRQIATAEYAHIAAFHEVDGDEHERD